MWGEQTRRVGCFSRLMEKHRISRSFYISFTAVYILTSVGQMSRFCTFDKNTLFCFFKPCGSASSLCDHSAVFMLAPSCVERTLTDRKVSECDSTFSGSFCFERTATTAFAPVVPDVDSACRTAALEGFAVRRLSILTPATLTWAWSDLDSLNS